MLLRDSREYLQEQHKDIDILTAPLCVAHSQPVTCPAIIRLAVRCLDLAVCLRTFSAAPAHYDAIWRLVRQTAIVIISCCNCLLQECGAYRMRTC